MEWVETTGRTIEEALDAALDELGVDENDVEYEVMSRPRGGLLGRFGGDARIRARVKPISREKPGEARRRARRPRQDNRRPRERVEKAGPNEARARTGGGGSGGEAGGGPRARRPGAGAGG